MSTKNYLCSDVSDSRERKSVKILILGDFGIGKTTLIKTYLELGHLPEDEENIFERYRLRMEHNRVEVDVELLDLSPGVSAPQRRQSYPTNVNAILLCFTIGEYGSLKSVYNLWIHEVHAHFGKLVPIFLVGLRNDVRVVKYFIDLSLLHPEVRVVERNEAETIHKKCHFHGDYMECSMYDRNSIVKVIQKAFSAAMED